MRHQFEEVDWSRDSFLGRWLAAKVNISEENGCLGKHFTRIYLGFYIDEYTKNNMKCRIIQLIVDIRRYLSTFNCLCKSLPQSENNLTLEFQVPIRCYSVSFAEMISSLIPQLDRRKWLMWTLKIKFSPILIPELSREGPAGINCVCVCVFVPLWTLIVAHTRAHTHTHTHPCWKIFPNMFRIK